MGIGKIILIIAVIFLVWSIAADKGLVEKGPLGTFTSKEDIDTPEIIDDAIDDYKGALSGREDDLTDKFGKGV